MELPKQHFWIQNFRMSCTESQLFMKPTNLNLNLYVVGLNFLIVTVWVNIYLQKNLRRKIKLLNWTKNSIVYNDLAFCWLWCSVCCKGESSSFQSFCSPLFFFSCCPSFSFIFLNSSSISISYELVVGKLQFLVFPYHFTFVWVKSMNDKLIICVY